MNVERQLDKRGAVTQARTARGMDANAASMPNVIPDPQPR